VKQFYADLETTLDDIPKKNIVIMQVTGMQRLEATTMDGRESWVSLDIKTRKTVKKGC